jgi:hypothetical protein
VPHLVFLTRLVFASLSSRRNPYLALAVAVAALLFYGLSAVPDANGGNWGEFQTFGYIGGIAHSPTYPLLTGSIWLVGHVFVFLEPAHAANLTNAGFAAAATLLGCQRDCQTADRSGGMGCRHRRRDRGRSDAVARPTFCRIRWQFGLSEV